MIQLKRESVVDLAPMEGNSPEEYWERERERERILRGLWKDSGEGC